LGINTWLMKGFFDSIPRDLDESAKIDGATDWQIFSRIIFPLGLYRSSSSIYSCRITSLAA